MDSTAILGLVVGSVIGLAFAWLQMQALRRNELLEQQLELSGWLKQIPGSGGRIAFLLIALVLAQVVFRNSVDIRWMAAGVAIAYSIPFALRIRDKYFRKK